MILSCKEVPKLKNFCFEWTEDYYLIHVQFDPIDSSALYDETLIICREFDGNVTKEEKRFIISKGFRFIISRSCPEERKVTIKYDNNIILKVFLIDDRAYYPTKIYFKG